MLRWLTLLSNWICKLLICNDGQLSYLNHCPPPGGASALLQQGWDVIRASELGLSTANDDQILESAILHDRVLITLDEHFGDWAVLPLESHPGVVRLKANPAISPTILALLIPFLNEHKQRSFRDHLVIVKPSSVRWIRTRH